MAFSKKYDPSFEADLYKRWQSEGYFQPQESKTGKKPFVMMLPPPNVTGVLHA